MRKRARTAVRICVLLAGIHLFLCPAGIKAADTPVLPADVSVPSEGCVFVGVKGRYAAESEQAVKRINELRREACREGYPNPSNPSKALTMDDYVPVKWSRELEKTARLRAAESFVLFEHVRPKGGFCLGMVKSDIIHINNEDIAGGAHSMVDAVDFWALEKSDWVKQNGWKETGHYTSMINPGNTYVGIGLFEYTACGHFGGTSRMSDTGTIDTNPLPAVGNCIQTIEIKKSSLGEPFFDEYMTADDYNDIENGENGVKIGRKKKFYLCIPVKSSSGYVSPLGNISWSSSNPSVAVVDKNGNTKIAGYGKAVVHGVSSDGFSASKTIVCIKSPSISSLKAEPGKLTVKWGKQTKNTTGYQIQYSTSSDFNFMNTKTIRIKGKSKTSKTIKLASKGTSYVRVRVYCQLNDKTYYSVWSKIKSVRTK